MAGVEHEYDVIVPRAEWQATNQKVRDALRAFLTSPLFERIRASDPKTWLPIETLDQFDELARHLEREAGLETPGVTA